MNDSRHPLEFMSHMLNVEGLYQITQEDNPDAVETQAQGWANAADMFQQEIDNLAKHRETVLGMWNSEAAAPYFRVVDETIRIIDQARTNAQTKSEAAAEIASNARWAKEKIAEEYEKWQKEKQNPTPGESPGLIEAGWNTLTAGSPSEAVLKNWNSSIPPDDERRKPFDKQAQEYFQVATENYERQRPVILQPLPEYKPIEGVDNPTPNNPAPTGAGGAAPGGPGGVTAGAPGGNHPTGTATAGPALQSGTPAPTPAPTAPAPTTGTPAPGGGGIPVGGLPFTGGRPPTPPATPPGSRPGTGPRSVAPRTPGLPSHRGGGPGQLPGRAGQHGSVPSRVGAQPGRGGSNQARTTGPQGRSGTTGRNQSPRPSLGRGPQKSQMAPKDRTGQVRRSGEVLGRRNPKADTKPQPAKQPQRQVPKGLIRGVKNKGANTSRTTPTDRTGRGFTSRVIGARPRTEFSRTPIVADKLDAAAGQRIFGKRASEGERSEQELADRKARRRAMLSPNAEGLSRPVIGNGIIHSAQLDTSVPVQPVKDEDALWRPDSVNTVPGVIGKSRTAVKPVVHDPGPTALPAKPTSDEQPGSERQQYDPGPTAFNGRQGPDRPVWP